MTESEAFQQLVHEWLQNGAEKKKINDINFEYRKIK